jgi:hypothetical protein
VSGDAFLVSEDKREANRKVINGFVAFVDVFKMGANAYRGLGACSALLLMIWPATARADHNVLLPQPQKVQYGSGSLNLDVVSISQFTAHTLEDGLRRFTGRKIPLVPTPGGPRIVLHRTGARRDPCSVALSCGERLHAYGCAIP